MTRRERRRHLVAAIVTCVAGATSCGTSIRALYESDVRFEHCMALDAAPEVKPTLQRACWEEWIRFYQFGQTRDRVDYATQRKQVLGSASDFDEGAPPGTKGAAPDPTSAIAPPPSMAQTSDAGVADASTPDAEAPRGCAAACEVGLEACRTTCRRTAPCEVACSARAKRCVARCEARVDGGVGQGSR
jgi:hypothetical protein